MSLRNVLATLPSNRETEALARDVLRLFQDHPNRWWSAEEVTLRLGRSKSEVAPLLAALADGFVLDFDGGQTQSYRYVPDTVVRREVEAFLRRAESHSGMLQANVARFRQRYTPR